MTLLQNPELFMIPSLVLLVPINYRLAGFVKKWRGLRPEDFEFGRKKLNTPNFQVPQTQHMTDHLTKQELKVCKASPSA